MTKNKPYHHGQLLLPLMQSLFEKGNSVKPKEIYGQVANKIGLSEEEKRQTKTTKSGEKFNIFQRDVRWVKQTAIKKGLIENHEKGLWSLSQKGLDKLGNAQTGILLTIFETPSGQALWGQLDTAIGAIADNSIDLLFTSPPYPHALKGYANGELNEDDWVSFMLDMITGYQPKMNGTGSMMLNIAETYLPSIPVKSEHISKLRVRLATETRFRVLDTLYWNNTSRLPSPFSWVAKRRIRVKPSAETVLWISENPFAHADNRAILDPYKIHPSKRHTGPLEQENIIRPSGHLISNKSFLRDNGGAIPGNVFNIGATNSSREYRDYVKACRKENLPLHPAIMPVELARKCIAFTTRPGGLVVDPMSGSFTTAVAAEQMGRRWIGSDISLAYITGARHRFPDRDENRTITSQYLDSFCST